MKVPTRPTPSVHRLLSGSNLHRINKREARFTRLDTALAAAPNWLDELARAEFIRLAPELIANGLLTRANVMLFAARCDAYARMVHAADDIRERGRWLTEPVFNTKSGEHVGNREKLNPNLAEVSRATHDMLRIDMEFGLTPAAAMKVAAEPGANAPKASFGDFVAGDDAVETEVEDDSGRQPN